VNEFTALAYARVSTDDKDQTTESQVREIRNWCSKNNIEILEIYKEEKPAGELKDHERPEFDRMMGRIIRERIDFIVAWSESRLSRNTDDMTDIMRILRTFNVKVRYVSSAVEPETSAGRLINHINTWQGEEERKKLSINTKNGMTTAKLKGTHCGRPLALVLEHHYEENKARVKLDGNSPTKIVPLKSIFDYAEMGYSVSKTAKAMGVGRNTLERELSKEGCLELYREISCSKGLVSKRVDSLYPTTEKTSSEYDVQKGTLLDTDKTLLNKEGSA
jgi:DNA invertase Pin-like site-specific DNA recombinase